MCCVVCLGSLRSGGGVAGQHTTHHYTARGAASCMLILRPPCYINSDNSPVDAWPSARLVGLYPLCLHPSGGHWKPPEPAGELAYLSGRKAVGGGGLALSWGGRGENNRRRSNPVSLLLQLSHCCQGDGGAWIQKVISREAFFPSSFDSKLLRSPRN